MTDYSRDIEKYLKGELTPAERNALERKALHDPFLADALEGAEQIKPGEFSNDVAELTKKIASKKGVSTWAWRARIAAGIAIVAASSFIVWTVMQPEPIQDLALEKSAPPTTLPEAADSVSPISGELSSSPAETSSASGPAVRDKDVATRSAHTPKKSTQPQLPAATDKSEIKKGPTAGAVAAETKTEEIKADELKVTEPIAQVKETEKAAEPARAKAEDDQERKLAKNSDAKKKAVTAEKQEAAPALQDALQGRAAGVAVAPNVIKGKVTSAEDGSALPGVNVIIKGSTIGTTTDATGNYQIETNVAEPTLVFSFIGLNSTEVKVANQQETDVKLSLDVSQLSEVVVTGYGVQSDRETLPPTVDMAHPEIGSRAFRQYLEKNLRYPDQAKTNKVEGRVTVEFTVESDGTLSNFTIIRGIGSGCDEELIRLIKEGSKWVPTKKDDVPVQDKVKVRLKFELPK